MTTALICVACVGGYLALVAGVCLFFRAASRLDEAHRLQPEQVPDHVPAEWSEQVL